jgi:hypothetical protein
MSQNGLEWLGRPSGVGWSLVFCRSLVGLALLRHAGMKRILLLLRCGQRVAEVLLIKMFRLALETGDCWALNPSVVKLICNLCSVKHPTNACPVSPY